MCQTLLWKDITTKESGNHGIDLTIIARRSDGKVFKFDQEFCCSSRKRQVEDIITKLENLRKQK